MAEEVLNLQLVSVQVDETDFLEIKYYIEIPKRNNKTKIKYY